MINALVTKKQLSVLILGTLLTVSASSVSAADYYYSGNGVETNTGGHAITTGTDFDAPVNYDLSNNYQPTSDPVPTVNDTVHYKGLEIRSDSGDSFAVNVNKSYTTIIENTQHEYTRPTTSYGISIYNDQSTDPVTLNIKGNVSTTITSTGQAVGLVAGANSIVNLSGDKNEFIIKGKGQEVIGIHTVGVGMHVTGDMIINVTNTGGADTAGYRRVQGINDQSKGNVIFDGIVNITVIGTGDTTLVDGIDHLSNTLTFNKDVTIDISGSGDNHKKIKGLNLSNNEDSITNFNGTLDIIASGENGSTVVGIDSTNSGGKKQANFEKKVTINSSGNGINNQNGTFIFKDNVEVTAGVVGVNANRSDNTQLGSIEFKKGLTVRPKENSVAAGFTAVSAARGGTININTAKQNGDVQLAGQIWANNNGTITTNLTTKDSYIDAENIISENGSTVHITSTGINEGITGDLRSANTGNLTIDLDKRGTLTGSSEVDSNSTLDVILNHTSTWNVTGTNNTLTTLNLGQNSIVNLADGRTGQTLTMENLIGSGGTFILDINATTVGDNDSIQVNNTFSNKTAKIALADISNSDTLAGAVGTVLATTKKVNSDSVVNTGRFWKADVETSLHWFDYKLKGIERSDSSGYIDWVIADESAEEDPIKPGDPTDPTDPPDPVEPPNPPDKPTSTTDTITSSAISSYYLWRDSDKLMQRLGDLRQSQNEDQGIWARIIRNGTEYDNNAYFHNNTSTMQLGYDKVVSRDAKDNYWVVGGAIEYLNGSGSYHYGSGDHSGTTFSLYGTRMGSKGHYLDLVAKAGKYNHHFNSYMIDGTSEKGDYDTLGYSISAEYGRKTPLNSGWYVEPQIQLTLGRLNSTDYVTMNGVKVNQDGINSAIGRIGFNIGRNVGKNTNFYLKANLNHEFGGRGHVSMSTGNDSRDEDLSMNDTWFTYGLGVATTMGKNGHLYFDIERSSGSDFTTDWQWNVGMRFKV